MDSKAGVPVNDKGEVAGLAHLRSGSVSERIKAFNGIAKDSNISGFVQSTRGNSGELLPPKISELMKLGDIENASSQALFGFVNRILDESIEKNNEEIPMHVASVLKLVVQEIEQRASEQADSMKKKNNLYKSRDERFHSKIKALETVASETTEKNEAIANQLQQIKNEKNKIEEEKKRLEEKDLLKLRKEKEICESKISSLNEELISAKECYEENLLKLKVKAEETEEELQKKILELEHCLVDSRQKMKEFEGFSGSKHLRRERKELGYRHFFNSQLGTIKELRLSSEFIKNEVSRIKNIYVEEFNHLGLNLKVLTDAARNYHGMLEENRKLHKEVQELKGNLRTYCRIRPLPRQSRTQTTIQNISENGELVIVNPTRPGKDGHRIFKFNKVFGPASTQEEVFQDTRPLIRSVLDGYNVCIFSYGQTGSGKTYTMTGPNAKSIVDWGINYRALNDLFNLSQKRCSNIAYDIGVQMIEIYNEQVHDLLCNQSFHKRLKIWNTSQTLGLDVHDGSIHQVNSITDILELMNMGSVTRALGATVWNERSSRSHSILTVHVRGTDLKTNSISRTCLHLVDLAGSERVDRSLATGHRLQESQHIDKSLSALGDVISALARKSPHVPYRSSKLTQVLQSSLGGKAKILMFAHLNSDVESYSETISTLKFAEKVSGIELAARDHDDRTIRDLREQVASLKDALAKKDEELRSLLSNKTSVSGMRLAKYASHSPRKHSNGATKRSQRPSGGKRSAEKAGSVISDNNSEISDRYSDTGSQSDDFKHHRDFFLQSRLAVGPEEEDDIELFCLGDPDTEERLSDISDGGLSMGTETDGSANSIIEYTLFPETTKLTEELTERASAPVKILEATTNIEQSRTTLLSLSKSSNKIPGYRKSTVSSSSAALKAHQRWQ